MIKIDLITGFLGSGKTTFILQYAKYLMSQGIRVGILEYDYGAVNVDMMLLHELRGEMCELEMLAAACDKDCLERRFRTKLISMAMSGYDRVIIEPSGVFDMDMFFDALREEPLENWYEIGSVITIVNAGLPEKLSEDEDYLLASQAVGAGCILFSRAQITSESQVEATKKHLYKAAEGIGCKSVKGKMVVKDWSAFTEQDYEQFMHSGYFIAAYRKAIAGGELSFSSVYFLNLQDNLETLQGKIQKVLQDKSHSYGNILRIKGFTEENGVGYQINVTPSESSIVPTNVMQRALIVIGTALQEEKLRDLFQDKI